MNIEETKTAIDALPENTDLHYWDNEAQMWLPDAEDALLSDGAKTLATDHSRLEAENQKLRTALEKIATKWGVLDAVSYTRKRIVADYLEYHAWAYEIAKQAVGRDPLTHEALAENGGAKDAD